jgi:hypothetical protein
MKHTPLLITIVTLVILSSCVTQRKVEYLQDSNKNIKEFKEAEFPDYRLKPNDELYIQITSLGGIGPGEILKHITFRDFVRRDSLLQGKLKYKA